MQRGGRTPLNIVKQIIFVSLILLALASGISEPLCRNSARIIFFISVVTVLTQQHAFDVVLRRKRLILSMLAFVGWIVISSFCAGHVPSTSDSSTYWLYFSHNMLLFIPIALFVDRERQLDWLFLALAISLALNDLVIEVQLYYGSDRPVTFLRGSFMQSALLYVILLPVYFIIALRSSRRPIKVLAWIFFLISLGAFILLKTRGAWLTMALVLSTTLLFCVREVRRLIAIGLIFLASTLAFLTIHPETVDRFETVINFSSEQSVSERFLIWQSALEMIRDNPILGIGFGNFEHEYQSKYIQPEAQERWQGHAHNTYLQLWAETGLVGLILYCAMFGGILRWAWRRRDNHYAAMILFSTVGFMLYSLTDYTYSSYSAMRVYWLELGLCMRGVDFAVDNNASAL